MTTQPIALGSTDAKVASGRAVLRAFWAISPVMTLFWGMSALYLLLGLAGLAFDGRQVLGQPVWAKSTKFALSFLLYAPTLLWVQTVTQVRPRLMRRILDLSAATLLVEMALLMVQAFRGQAMHFNVATPFDAALWTAMSISIMVFYLANIVGFVLLLRQPLADPAFGWSLRLGMLLMMIGFGLGFLMTGPRPEQMALIHAGEQSPFIGGHTVGAPDGGPGAPFLGWSRDHGDLRVAHFVGIHGAQFMALIGWLMLLATRRPRHSLRPGHRLAMVWGGFLSYLGLVALITWQALRGQPLLQPDRLTVSALAALIALTGLWVGGVVWSAARSRGLVNA